ncbi:hypothetical protein P5673_010961 [Acropora cervicornis]|uniref:WH1 domain-containing protein n=1 Tax=Acropora cervicornis TaxID=6130 RepID=A0AAD9QQ40_ACRCE|nr:hypothetical protein P5673_010961 [Acropora cervicornis]
MSKRDSSRDEAFSDRLSEKDIFKIRLSLSCLSNRVVVCGSTAKLFYWTPPSAASLSNKWTSARSGVPVLVISSGDSGDRNPKGAYVGLVETDSGFSTWKETLTSSSNYREQQRNFHTLMLSTGDGTMAGLRFNNEDAARVFLKEVQDAVQEVLSVSSVPELNKPQPNVNKERLKKFRKLKKVEISTPCLFSHVTSITSATQIGGETGRAQENRERDGSRAFNATFSRPAHIRRAFSMSKTRK